MNGALPFEAEKNNCVSDACGNAKIVRGGDGVYLEIELPQAMFDMRETLVTSRRLGMTRITEGRFERPDGGDLKIDTDFLGGDLKGTIVAGPLQRLHAGKNRVKIWNAPCGR